VGCRGETPSTGKRRVHPNCDVKTRRCHVERPRFTRRTWGTLRVGEANLADGTERTLGGARVAEALTKTPRAKPAHGAPELGFIDCDVKTRRVMWKDPGSQGEPGAPCVSVGKILLEENKDAGRGEGCWCINKNPTRKTHAWGTRRYRARSTQRLQIEAQTARKVAAPTRDETEALTALEIEAPTLHKMEASPARRIEARKKLRQS
jgi:hypothetical protein